MPRDFTAGEGTALIEGWQDYLNKAKASIEAGRFVEAESWIERLKVDLNEQDVFGMLATYEVADSVRHLH